MADTPLDLAVRALRVRDRSAQELDERLARAGVSAEERAGTLATLERMGYLDDARLAAVRAETLAARGYGDEAIRVDLQRRGIAGEGCEAALAALAPEAERARELVRRRGATARTARRLAAKGFSLEAVEAAVGPETEESI
jgi:SOS response regulatory protein OraA/RecX